MAENSPELFDAGHRACGGCGPALAARLIMKGSGENTIVYASTACMQVFFTTLTGDTPGNCLDQYLFEVR